MVRFNISLLSKNLICAMLMLLSLPLYSQQGEAEEGRLRVHLERGAFWATYELVLNKNGLNEVNDADAPLLGDGLVALAGLSPKGTRLAIDERRADTNRIMVKLYVKGWSGGDYALKFSPGALLRHYDLKLEDDELQSSKHITLTDTVYAFSMEADPPSGAGRPRFTLILEPKKHLYKKAPDSSLVHVYPNPFHDLYVDAHLYHRPIIVTIRDFAGRLALRSTIAASCTECKLAVQSLPPGLYFVELFDQQDGRRIRSLKMIKDSTYD